jgi:hypothetical protein
LTPLGEGGTARPTFAPFIWKAASTLPTRSTTTIVAGRARACASATAWAMICCTSAVVSASCWGSAKSRVAAGGTGPGVGPALLPPPPPQEESSKAAMVIVEAALRFILHFISIV